MPSRDAILAVLRTIPDPELPISIVDLGLVEDISIEMSRGREGAMATIKLLPTFIGCPALEMIAGDVRAKISSLPGIDDVKVDWQHAPPWSVERISAAGRASLKAHGVTVPDHGSHLNVPGHHPGNVQLRISAVACPFCGSNSTYLDSPFGPTRCRMIYYCESCRNSFEHMKQLHVPS